MHSLNLPAIRSRRPAWNKGRIVGHKRPLLPKHVWAIRVRLELADRVRGAMMKHPPTRIRAPGAQWTRGSASRSRLSRYRSREGRRSSAPTAGAPSSTSTGLARAFCAFVTRSDASARRSCRGRGRIFFRELRIRLSEPLCRRRSPAPALRLAAVGQAIAPARRGLAASADPLAGPFTLETGPATQAEARAGHVAGPASAMGVILLRVCHMLSFRPAARARIC